MEGQHSLKPERQRSSNTKNARGLGLRASNTSPGKKNFLKRDRAFFRLLECRLDPAPAHWQSIPGVIFRAVHNYTRNIIQLSMGRGSIEKKLGGHCLLLGQGFGEFLYFGHMSHSLNS